MGFAAPNLYDCSTMENLVWPETLPPNSGDCHENVRRCVYYDEDIPNYIFVQTDKPPFCGDPCQWRPTWYNPCSEDSECPAGLCCNGSTCGACPTGACCNFGSCTTSTQSECASQGGIWQGAFTTCEDGSCQNRCCVQRENENGCLVTVCEEGHFYCSSNCYYPDAPNPSMTGLPDCQNGTELHNTVTVAGVVFNTGDSAFDSFLSGAVNKSYSITRDDCFGNDSSVGGGQLSFPIGEGHFAIVGFPGTAMRTASIVIYNPNTNPPFVVSLSKNEGFRSSIITSCGSSLYDCGQGVSGSPDNFSGLGDYTNATIYTS